MMITDDPARDFDSWDAEQAKQRGRYEREEARTCLVCGAYAEKPYYDIYPEDRDGVICKDCAQREKTKAKGILKGQFVAAIEDAMDYYYTV